MELVQKRGFKQTEVGLIPEDWEVLKIADSLNFKNGLNKASEFFGHGTPIINYMDVFNYNGITKSDVQGKVFLTNEEIKNFSARKGDVFFTRTSETQDEIGISAVLLDEIPDCVFSGFVLRGRPCNNLVHSDYYQYCFIPQYVRKQIISKSSYTTRALTNGRHLSSIKLILPKSHKEQQAIATALSDVDALISSLDGLIAKKKAIKQGAMQQLLTPPSKGGRRLPGFEGEWEEKMLGDVCSINMGQSPLSSNYNTEGKGLPLIQGNADIKKRKTIIRNYTSQITKIADEGDIIMSVRAPVGEIAYSAFKCCIGRGVCAIKFDNDFLYHYLIFKESSWAKFSTGSTFDSINSSQLKSLIISIPKDDAEQKAIAQILSDMDLEIEQLAAKKEKYTQVKQGMMQELLTGKTRLV
ncbi:MAG TPA: restriction endonuclease subunit S [Leeuwenhoekiella sp.]|nr:restriction endonuclease subunit S [Leeuwenhoekiella sp.]